MRIEIGGIRLDVQTENSIGRDTTDLAYGYFINKKAPKTESVDTTIRLLFQRIPSINEKTKIFNSGQSWSMYRADGKYWIKYHPPSFEDPLWLAITDSAFSDVTIFCSRQLINPTDENALVANPVRYPLDQILLMYILAEKGGAIVHAAGIDVNGQGYIFPGKSGAGKSTIARQFAAHEHIGMLSDDRIVVRKIDREFKAFGTPWPGDAKIAANRSVPLSGLFFIHHGQKNVIKEIKPREAVEKLLPVVSVPWYDREIFPKVLSFCDDLVSQVPAYEFHFEPTPEGVDVFEKFISGK